jgi:hypothetical protein
VADPRRSGDLDYEDESGTITVAFKKPEGLPARPCPAAAHSPTNGLRAIGELGNVAAERALIGYLETWVQDRVRPDSVQVPGVMLPHCGCPPLSLAWLTQGPPGTVRGEARKGFAQLEVAVPSSPEIHLESPGRNIWA